MNTSRTYTRPAALILPPVLSVIEVKKTPWLDGSKARTAVERLRCTRGHADIYLEHQAVWQLVDEQSNGSTRPEFLYRMEDAGDYLRLLLMSNRALSDLSKPVPALAAGTTIAWKLRANPTAEIDRKRTPINCAGGLEAWAKRKLSAALAVEELNFSVLPPKVGYRNDDRLTIHSVEFAGTATVRDPVELRKLLFSGVGRAKRFGFGMLFWRTLPRGSGR